MALKKEAAEKLKNVYGIDVTKLEAAIKATDEQDFEIPEVTVLSATDLATRDATKIAEGKTAGETDARKAFVAEIGKRLNFTPKGDRIADLVTDLQSRINASGDEKTKMLQDQVNALTKDKETLTASIEQEKKNAAAVKFDSDLIGLFPAGRSSEMTDAERLTLIKSGLTFETVDGKTVVKKNGEILKDTKTHAPVDVKTAVESYFKEKPFLMGAPAGGSGGAGGRGGKDNTGGSGGSGFKKYSEVKDAWLKEHPEGNPVSPEFSKHLADVTKDVPDFDFYN